MSRASGLTRLRPKFTPTLLDCNNGFAPITGATSQSYAAVANGNYAVAVTINNCTDTSACHAITTVGISENTNDSHLSVFPNPVDKLLTIDFGRNEKNISVIITGADGRLIIKSDFNDRKKSFHISTESWMQGIYILKITSADRTDVVKVVKE